MTATSAPQRDSHIVARNSVLMFGRYAGIWALNVLLVLFLPRYLGAEGLGHLQFALSLSSLFMIAVTLGVRNYLVKEIARDRGQLARYLGSAIGLRILLATAIAGVMALVVEATGLEGTAKWVVYVVVAWMVVTSVGRLFVGLLQGLENMGWAAAGEVANKALAVGLGVGLLVLGHGVLVYAGALIAGALAEVILLGLYLRRYTSLRVDFNVPRMKQLVIGGSPFLLMGFLLNVYQHIDIVMLRSMTSATVVGWHSAAFQIFRSIEFLPVVLTTALLPTLSRLQRRDVAAMGAIARRSISVQMLMMAPIAVGLSLLASDLIALLPYPDTFQNSTGVLIVLAITTPITGMLMLFGTIAMSADRQKIWAFGLAATVVFNIGLNSVLIPYFQETYGNGAIGAAVATLTSEAFMVAVGVWLLPPRVLDLSILWSFFKVGVAAAVLGVMVYFGRTMDLGIPVLVPAGAVLYGVAAFALRAIRREDVEFVRRSVMTKVRSE